MFGRHYNERQSCGPGGIEMKGWTKWDHLKECTGRWMSIRLAEAKQKAIKEASKK